MVSVLLQLTVSGSWAALLCLDMQREFVSFLDCTLNVWL